MCLYYIVPLIPYNVTVVAVNVKGNGPPVTLLAFTKEGGLHIHFYLIINAFVIVPPSPENVEVSRINGTAMIISWSLIPITDSNGIIGSYHITYIPATINGISENVTVSGNESSVIITGLDVDVAYSVSVSASTGAGMGNDSDPVIVETLNSKKFIFGLIF